MEYEPQKAHGSKVPPKILIATLKVQTIDGAVKAVKRQQLLSITSKTTLRYIPGTSTCLPSHPVVPVGLAMVKDSLLGAVETAVVLVPGAAAMIATLICASLAGK